MSTSTDNKSSTTENKSSASGPPLTGPNRFVWVELRTDQVEKAKEFYSTLLGWTYSQSAAYASTTFLHQEDGKPPFGSMLEVGSDGEHVNEWCVYVQTEDLEASVAKGKELGAKVFKEIDRYPGGGTAVLQDPNGGLLGLHTSEKDPSSFSGLGIPVWYEYGTDDLAVDEKFFGDLFSWKCDESPHFRGYTRVARTEAELKAKQAFAGFIKRWEFASSPKWVLYLSCSNTDEKTAAAIAAGGKIVMEPFDIPHTGRCSFVADPLGSVFCFWSALADSRGTKRKAQDAPEEVQGGGKRTGTGGDIHFELEVNVPVDQAFAAVSTAAGIANWWTPYMDEDGDRVKFSFVKREGKCSIFRVTRREIVKESKDEAKVDFHCLGGNLGEQDWDNTRFSFVVRRLSDSRSGIEFTHHGINDSVGCYSHVNKAWGVIVTKYLAKYIETGDVDTWELATNGPDPSATTE